MRDRLIELFKQKSCVYNECEKECSSCGNFEMYDSTIEHIADYLLENGVIVPPCKVGDTVYVITDCSKIMMHYDNDYLTGTGAIECPYEGVCKFEECNDENIQVIETYVCHLLNDEYDDWTFGCEHINCCYKFRALF